ncbi:hypothetical protein BQ8794_100069 [Mesorhizobium prunaredense]|uniref:Uncharacterized protein n=1 Tax=Mesorhizobium prunaredense TaxID=1631249 RepID=A0A1R3UZW1_9HYPH|nr:hypothetical protein BQ8794_100069 [Mesorhizobium prunaredense]
MRRAFCVQLTDSNGVMLFIGMVKNLAKVAHVDRLIADGTLHESARLQLSASCRAAFPCSQWLRRIFIDLQR